MEKNGDRSCWPIIGKGLIVWHYRKWEEEKVDFLGEVTKTHNQDWWKKMTEGRMRDKEECWETNNKERLIEVFICKEIQVKASHVTHFSWESIEVSEAKVKLSLASVNVGLTIQKNFKHRRNWCSAGFIYPLEIKLGCSSHLAPQF